MEVHIYMPDLSHLDKRYFIDASVYNCPFCNRRNVLYRITGRFQFDWDDKKKCRGFIVLCSSCKNESMHLTFADQEVLACHNLQDEFGRRISELYKFGINEDEVVLDDIMFYSVPTSFFVLDKRVPPVLRELLTEAEGCLKGNFLTGSSACARKIIYELAKLEKAEGGSYEDRIKSLKSIHPEVESTYFDTLLTIQQITSSKVHENSYDGWEGKHLRVILATLSEVLHELYVLPALRKDRRNEIAAMKKELVGEKPEKSTPGEEVNAG